MYVEAILKPCVNYSIASLILSLEVGCIVILQSKSAESSISENMYNRVQIERKTQFSLLLRRNQWGLLPLQEH